MDWLSRLDGYAAAESDTGTIGDRNDVAAV